MNSDGTGRLKSDPNWTGFNDRIEENLVREESELFRATRPLRIAKRVLIICMILFPAALIGSLVYSSRSYRRPLSPEQPALPHPDATKNEQPVLDRVKPAMIERYGLKEFKVKYTESALCIRIRTDETRGPRVHQAFGLMEDIRDMRRTVRGLPTCAWMLEIDHEAMDGGMTIVLPDEKCGYKAHPEWHNDALYTAAPPTAGKARQ